MRRETKAILAGRTRGPERESSAPIYATSGFAFDDAEQMRAVFSGEQEGNIYSRFTNPNTRELSEKMAALEGTESAIATASGMSAIFATFASLLSAGDHFMLSRAVFGSTLTICRQFFERWGVTYSLVDPSDPAQWASAVQPTTRFVYLETPSNPGLQIVDLEWVGRFCSSHGLLSIVDNCFATPYLQRPREFGIDIIVHSATKFIDGQGRVLGGVICADQPVIDRIMPFMRGAGPSLSPFNAWELSKSLETLHVRMDRHCSNALALAHFLKAHSRVEQVLYPFLPSHPAYETARHQMDQGGGIVTFEHKGGLAGGRQFLDRLEWVTRSANLGDSKTIVTHPASTTHFSWTAEERAAAGITDGMIRVSVGLEHIQDIVEEVEQALH